MAAMLVSYAITVNEILFVKVPPRLPPLLISCVNQLLPLLMQGVQDYVPD